MNRTVKKTFLTLSVLTAFAVPSVTMAANVGGGIWNYGVGYTGTYGYSNYYHPSRSHYAEVRNGETHNSQRQGAGSWAKTSITKIPPTGMSYHYGF